MIGYRIIAAFVIAALVGGGVWGLIHQIQRNGALAEQLKQQAQKTAEADARTTALKAEMEVRDATIAALEEQRNDLAQRKEQVRQVVRTVYRDPEVRPWAEAAPPPAVVAAANAALACLWQPTTDTGHADCTGHAAAPADAGLPAPAGEPEHKR